MSLFQSGIVHPDDLKSKMNDGYEDWLGEIGNQVAAGATDPVTSAVLEILARQGAVPAFTGE